MQRRTVLALASGIALPLTGCVAERPAGPAGTTDDSTPTRTSTAPSPTETPNGAYDLGETHEAPDGTTATVSDATVRKLIRSTSVGSSTHIDVACLSDAQFVVLDASATAPDGADHLADVRFALTVDGVRYPPPDAHWYWAIPPGSYERPGQPAFPAPVEAASEAGVVWLRDGEVVARWQLPTETVDRLGQAPSFDVRSLEAPDSVSRDDSVEASFTVANEGDRDGRYVAEFGAGPLSDHGEVVLSVPAGEERTHSAHLEPAYTEETESIDVTLEAGCERRRRTVDVTG